MAGGGVLLKRCIVINQGTNNSISVGKLSRFENCTFRFLGNNNHIIVGESCYFKDVEFWIENDDNSIQIDNKVKFTGKAHLACTEGKRIVFGDDCLVSNEVIFRTGDSHSILDMDGRRINHAKDVIVGNHVWIGNRAILLKGATIPSECVIGTGAIVPSGSYESNSVIAGVPAKVIQSNIAWSYDRIMDINQ